MSQPPYSGQPHPGQQPPSGEPQSGQPYQGGQYQGQPYSGQPNPDVPTSVPPSYPPTTAYPSSGQPEYGQPPYGTPQPQYGAPQPQYNDPQYGTPQPQHGDPQYGTPQPQYGDPQQPGVQPPPPYGQSPYGQSPYGAQPGAGLPAYGQQGFGQPGFLPPTPPKKKSKTLPIVLTAVAIVLVLCVGGVVALFMVGKNAVDDANDAIEADSTPGSGTTQETPGPTKAVGTVKISEPATLGGRPKLTDPQFAGVADQLQSSLKNVPGATTSVGALYGTVQKQDIVIAAAAEAPIDNPEKELEQTFLSAGIGGMKISEITEASTGTLGGAAKCGQATATDVDMAFCSWADEGSLGMVIWYFQPVSKAKAEFPKLRAQIETKG
jgi:hypothetical protein